MKILLATLAILAGMLVPMGAWATNLPKQHKKVTICHVPPGNPENAHTIRVGKKAAKAHLRLHEGDHYGRCVVVTPTPTPTATPTATPTPTPTATPTPTPTATPTPPPCPEPNPNCPEPTPTPTPTPTPEQLPGPPGPQGPQGIPGPIGGFPPTCESGRTAKWRVIVLRSHRVRSLRATFEGSRTPVKKGLTRNGRVLYTVTIDLSGLPRGTYAARVRYRVSINGRPFRRGTNVSLRRACYGNVRGGFGEGLNRFPIALI